MDSSHENPSCSFYKERSTKYSCISCNISVCNICSTAANVDSDGYAEEGKKVGKCPSCPCKGDPVILNVTQIESKAKVQKTMKEMFGIKSVEEEPHEKISKKKVGQSNPKQHCTSSVTSKLEKTRTVSVSTVEN